MTLNKIADGIYIDDTIQNSLKNLDSIIFDCDGVLIDVSESYDLVIQKTTAYILKVYAGISESIPITSKIIDGFKTTGGFNDEVDLTYASILSLIGSNKLKKDDDDFIFQVIENANQTGIVSVENYLQNIDADISEIKKILDYPGQNHQNLLYSTFDQLFYGPELYSKLFNKKSQFFENGFIENDKVIVNKELLSTLKKKFNDKTSIVTGRGIESIIYSLEELLDEFNVKQSVFLEDEPRSIAKPNPESLIRTIQGLESSFCLYVGDSMEDYIMAQKASEMGNKTIFCGIIGTSKNPEQKQSFFEKQNVSMILDSIHQIPKALNLDSV